MKQKLLRFLDRTHIRLTNSLRTVKRGHIEKVGKIYQNDKGWLIIDGFVIDGMNQSLCCFEMIEGRLHVVGHDFGVTHTGPIEFRNCDLSRARFVGIRRTSSQKA